ncbi:GNAT family N-acetyltransferase [Streptomyces sp. DSM 44915]|uniref:GNAT family N-acetyltransferase n=1 Tax=Streptomyces chisholmiae TaxID=3075540 RepID=A0ABU2K148_9ACTN|nr:GNAT family N-acetyltransferase [Streptomyces sp. DSM 44915]MDT0270484.1 GNAT family N-acetyltransferase [Streptomyces sp. DSM 44915]
MTVTSPRLARVTPENVSAACRLAVRRDQEHLVAPVAHSLAEAYASPDTAWPRLVYDGDQLVAFVMGGFDPENEISLFRCGVWRLNVGAEFQGRGYGRFAVDELLAEARRRGQRRVTVMWETGPGSPEPFYLRMGFRPTGEVFAGEVVGELFLDDA